MPVDKKKVLEDLYEIVIKSPSKEDGIIKIEAYLTSIDVFNLKACKSCGNFFERVTKWQKFCCETCKLDYHEKKNGKRFDPAKHKRRQNDNGLQAVPIGDGILVRPK